MTLLHSRLVFYPFNACIPASRAVHDKHCNVEQSFIEQTLKIVKEVCPSVQQAFIHGDPDAQPSVQNSLGAQLIVNRRIVLTEKKII